MAVDRAQVGQFVKELLKHGTPDWVRFPEDYRAMVQEWEAKTREDLLAECRAYRHEDQDILSDVESRRCNPIRASEFMQKLRDAGVKCFSHASTLEDGSASLFCLTPYGSEPKPMASIQVPMMWEWSTIRLDPNTKLPTGFRDIGWRSAELSLIRHGVLTEDEAHRIFGRPRVSRVSKVWRQQLHAIRNGGHRNAA